MNSKIFYKSLRISILMLGAFLLNAASSYALDLAAVEAEWTPPGSTTAISMWGFVADSGTCPVAPVAWAPGPEQLGVAGGSLSINLRNCLSEPVSIIIPGQATGLSPQFVTDTQGRARVRAFTHEAAAGGGTATYTWSTLKTGTFLYQSGSHPAKQVQMGLYGALKVGSYPGVINEVTLLYSEIDPVLHATSSAATPLSYKPKYFLVNGQSYAAGQPAIPAGMVNTTKLIRFLNAGLRSHTPVVQGPYMNVIAEDGNFYPYSREQYSVLLPAGKTLDALWVPTEVKAHGVYDRSLSLSSNGAAGGGMLVYLDVAPAGSLPLADAGPDQSGVQLGIAVSLDGNLSTGGVTYNWSFTLKPGGSVASLTGPTTVNPTFIPDVAGTYVVQLVVNDGVSNSTPDTVVISTNSVPIADAGPDQAVTVGDGVVLDGSASSDADLDPLTYSWVLSQKPAGSVAVLSGATTVGPTFTADLAGSYEVQLTVNDGFQDSVTDMVIVVASPPSITPPTAVDDFASLQMNSLATFIDVLANDIDGDGVIDPASIVITSGSTTVEGGRVAAKIGGIRYRPLQDFVGTDTFTYTVMDNLGGVSNVGTVSVTVLP
jgi:FtsP/CotA-like multicopper oxidase with cupredoxin domain